MKKIFLAAVLAAASCIYGNAQIDTLTTTDTLEITVYANKFAENSKRIAQTVRVIRDKPALNFQPSVDQHRKFICSKEPAGWQQSCNSWI
jgi:hypothetical protein